MSYNVDSEVVKMIFDNSEFEGNVESSLGTLDRLKQALNFETSKDGIESLSGALADIDVNSLADSVEYLKNRFSNLGIFGMTAVQNISSSLLGKAWDLISAVPAQISSGGWKRAANLEQAKFQLEGLLKDGEKVANVMTDVNTAVDGTAYGLDEAAVIASQLAASGIKSSKDAVGELTNMETVLKAISGTAAMTGDSYSNIGQIFATVAGNGKMMTSELNRLGARGLNGAAVLADFLKTDPEALQRAYDRAYAHSPKKAAALDWSAENIDEAFVREITSMGAIDAGMFFESFSDAFAEHATKANETYEGAFANMKSALSRIGAEIATPLRANLRDVFNSLRRVFNSLKDFLMPGIELFNKASTSVFKLITGFFDFGEAVDDVKHKYTGEAMRNIFAGLTDLFSDLFDIVKPIGKAIQDFFPAVTVEKLVAKTRTIKSAFTAMGETLKSIFQEKDTYDIVSGILNLFSLLLKPVKALFNIFKVFSPLLGAIIANAMSILAFGGRVITFINQLLDRIGLIIRVGGAMYGFANIGKTISDIIAKIADFAKKHTIGNALRFIADLISRMDITKWLISVTSGFKEIGNFIAKPFAHAVPAFADFFERIEEKTDSLKDKAATAVTAIDGVLIKLKDRLTSIYSFLFGEGGALTYYVQDIQNALSSVYNWLVSKLIPSSDKAMASIFGGVKKVYGILKDFFMFLFGETGILTPTVNAITEAISKKATFIGSRLKEIHLWISNISGAVSKFFKSFFGKGKDFKMFAETIGSATKQFFKDFIDDSGKIVVTTDKLRSAYQKLRTAIKNAFHNLTIEGKAIPALLGEIEEKTKAFWNNFKLTSGLGNVWDKIRSTFEKLKESVVGAFSVINDSIKSFGSTTDSVKDKFSSFKDSLSGLFDGVKSSVDEKAFNRPLARLRTVTEGKGLSSKPLKEYLASIGQLGVVVSDTQAGISRMTTAVNDGGSSIREFGDNALEASENTTIFQKAVGLLKKAVDKIKEALSKVGEFFKKIFDTLTQTGSLTTVINLISSFLMGFGTFKIFKGLGKISTGIGKFFDGIGSIGEMIENGRDALKALKEDLEELQKAIKSKTIKNIAVAVLILAGAMLVISKIDSDKLAQTLGSFALLMSEVMASLQILDNMFGGKSAEDMGGMAKATASMIPFAIAILLLTGAFKKFEDISWDAVGKGVAAIGGIAIELAAVTKMLGAGDNQKGLLGGGLAMMGFAGAVRMLIKPIKEIGEMDPKVLTQGLNSLLDITVFMSLFALAGKGFDTSAGLGILAMAASLYVLIPMLEYLNAQPWPKLLKSIGWLGVIIGELTLMMHFATAGKDQKGFNLSSGLGLIAAAAALLILIPVLKKLGEMKGTDIAKSIAAIAGALAILWVATLAFSDTNSKEGILGLIGAAVALGILTPPLRALGEMSLPAIGKALLVLAGAFLVIGVASYALAPVADILLAVSGGLALIGAAVLMAGAGVLAFATALSIFAVSGTAGIAALGLMAVEFADALALFIIELGKKKKEIAESFLDMFLQFLVTLREYAPQILEQIFGLFDDIKAIIKERTGDKDIFESGVTMLLNFVNGCLDSLERHEEDIANAVRRFFKIMLDTICLILGIHSPSKKAEEIGDMFVQGLINGFEFMWEVLKVIVKKLGSKLLEWVKGKLSDWKEAGKEKMAKIKEGFEANKQVVMTSLTGIGKKALDTLKEKYPDFYNFGADAIKRIKDGLVETWDWLKRGVGWILEKLGFEFDWYDGAYSSGQNVMRGFRNGMDSLANEVYNVAAVIGSNALSTLNRTVEVESPSKATFRTGRFFDLGLINGMKALSGKVSNASEDVATTALNAFDDNFDTDFNFNPVITPVIDSSGVATGIAAIDDIFGTHPFNIYGTVGSRFQNVFGNGMLKVDNSDVVETLESMMSEISDLGNRISRMQMVVDSGALVGQIAPYMDNALGRIAIRRDRG